MDGAKVFIKIDSHREVADIISLIRGKIDDCNGIIEDLNQLKEKEDSELEVWNRNADNIKEKSHYIEKVLIQENV